MNADLDESRKAWWPHVKDEFGENLGRFIHEFRYRAMMLPTSPKSFILEKQCKGVEVLGNLYRTNTDYSQSIQVQHELYKAMQDLKIL